MKTVFFTICCLITGSAGVAQSAERIVLITDKQWYYPTESVWFSLHVFDACTDTLSKLSKIVYVELIGTVNRSVQQIKVTVNDAHANGSFVVNESVATGTYQLVAYTNWMKNFGAECFCRQNIHVVNPLRQASVNIAQNNQVSDSHPQTKMTVGLPKKIFAKRERVPVMVTNMSSSHLIVSVFKRDALQHGATNITYDVAANPCKVKQPVRFTAETRGDIVSGRVIDKHSQQPAAGIRGYLSVADSPNDLFVATSDSSGTINFEVGDLLGKRELIVQTNTNIDSNYSIELLHEYAEQSRVSVDGEKGNVFETATAAVNDAMVSIQVQQYFHSPDGRNQDTSAGHEIPFYGKPDALYLMNDYVRFTTVEEIFREYITLVGIQIRKHHLLPVVYDVQADRKPFTGLPLVLVNGVPVFDFDRLMAMNADDFYSIGVIGKKYYFGYQMFYGVIDIRLKKPFTDFGRNVTVLDFDGASYRKVFTSPVYADDSNRNDRTPDFRNVLYWNPELQKDRKGNYGFNFYASDIEGEYVIVVRCVSETGTVETSQAFIQVK
jgi:hypothetical protein